MKKTDVAMVAIGVLSLLMLGGGIVCLVVATSIDPLEDYLELLPQRMKGEVCPFESCKELWDNQVNGRYAWGIDNSDTALEEDTFLCTYERDIRKVIMARLEKNYKPGFRRDIYVSQHITITKLSWIPPEKKKEQK